MSRLFADVAVGLGGRGGVRGGTAAESPALLQLLRRVEVAGTAAAGVGVFLGLGLGLGWRSRAGGGSGKGQLRLGFEVLGRVRGVLS